jgi:hypothetical protein
MMVAAGDGAMNANKTREDRDLAAFVISALICWYVCYTTCVHPSVTHSWHTDLGSHARCIDVCTESIYSKTSCDSIRLIPRGW